MEHFGLEGTLNIISFQPPCHGQGHLALDQVAQSPVQPGHGNEHAFPHIASITRVWEPDSISRALPDAVEKVLQSSKILRQSIRRSKMSSALWEAAMGIAVLATATEGG